MSVTISNCSNSTLKLDVAIQTHRLGKNKFLTLDSYYRPNPPVVAITATVVGVLLVLGTIYTMSKVKEPPVVPIPVQPYQPSNQINS